MVRSCRTILEGASATRLLTKFTRLFSQTVDSAKILLRPIASTLRKAAPITPWAEAAQSPEEVLLLLIDDPIKDREEANRETIRNSLHEWFASVAYTRLTPKGAIIVIQTRWHEDDLAGWLLREHASAAN